VPPTFAYIPYHSTTLASITRASNTSQLRSADVVVVRFGSQYKQWNAAFEAGFAQALNKPVITIHPPAISHMLKEVNAKAAAVAQSEQEVVAILRYSLGKGLPKHPADGDKYIKSADIWGAGNPNPTN